MFQSSIESFHACANSGDLPGIEKHLSSDRKMILSRDQFGRTALHKAAKGGFAEIAIKLLNGDLAQADYLAKAVDKVPEARFLNILSTS